MKLYPGQRFIHNKTQDTYEVIYIAKAAWDINQELVVYKKIGDNIIWVRSLSEFNDGRFIPRD
jgi:hypothetical protein